MMRPELEQLVQLVTPPQSLVRLGYAPDWDDIERRLGFELPSDYKAFADLYGPGEFCDQVVVFVPWEENAPDPFQRDDFVDRFHSSVTHLENLRSETGLFGGVPLWPEPGGLVPLGGITTGSDLFWVMNGLDPETWTCAEISQFMEPQPHECNLTTLLVRWLSDELTTDYLSPNPDPLPSGPYFESTAGKSRVTGGIHVALPDWDVAMGLLSEAIVVPWVLWGEHASERQRQYRWYVPDLDWSLSVTMTGTGIGVTGRVSPATYGEFDAMVFRLAQALGAPDTDVKFERNYVPPDLAT